MNGVSNAEIFQRVPRDTLFEDLACDTRFQSDQELGMWFGADDMPHLRFSPSSGGLFELGGISIIGMDLNR